MRGMVVDPLVLCALTGVHVGLVEGRQLLVVTKVQMENLGVGWYHSNFVTPIAIPASNTKPIKIF